LDIFLISGILNKNKLGELVNLAIKPAKIRKSNKNTPETNGYKNRGTVTNQRAILSKKLTGM